MSYKDYYKILGLAKDASAKEIKKAYRKLASEFHPDKNPGDKKAEDKFKEVNEAHEVLADPDKRKKYDTLGPEWEAYQQGGGNWEQYQRSRRPGGGQTFYYEGDPSAFFGEGESDDPGFSNFFEQFFGQGRRGGFQSGQRQRSSSFRGQDLEAEMPITLLEAFHGSKRTFELHGNKLRITIKPGAYNGQRLRIKGKGQKGHQGAANGDLYLVLHIEPDPRFTRKKDDLISNIDVDLYAAVLGGNIKVPTLSGAVSLKIPKGVQNGKILRLKGKGMPKYNKADQFGDMLVQLKIDIPKNISKEEEALFRKLQQMTSKKTANAT